MKDRLYRRTAIGCFLLGLVIAAAAKAGPEDWRREWPRTDCSRHSADYSEIFSGGPPKDGIPAIDRPLFAPVGEIWDLAPREPVISIRLGTVARAYPCAS